MSATQDNAEEIIILKKKWVDLESNSKEIVELPATSTSNDTDKIPIEQSGTTKHIEKSDFLNGLATSQSVTDLQGEVDLNTDKVGITPQQATDIQVNTDKVGITTEQSNNIEYNLLAHINAFQKNKTLNFDANGDGVIVINGNNLDVISDLRIVLLETTITPVLTIYDNRIICTFSGVTSIIEGRYRIEYQLNTNTGLRPPNPNTWIALKTIDNINIFVNVFDNIDFKNTYSISDNVILFKYVDDVSGFLGNTNFDSSWEDLIRDDNLYIIEIKDNIVNDKFYLETTTQLTDFNQVNLPPTFVFENSASYFFKKLDQKDSLSINDVFQIQKVTAGVMTESVRTTQLQIGRMYVANITDWHSAISNYGFVNTNNVTSYGATADSNPSKLIPSIYVAPKNETIKNISLQGYASGTGDYIFKVIKYNRLDLTNLVTVMPSTAVTSTHSEYIKYLDVDVNIPILKGEVVALLWKCSATGKYILAPNFLISTE